MNQLLQKKVNLLIHLAKADGHLDESEKKLIQEILTEAGEHNPINWNQSTTKAFETISDIKEKEKLLHAALRLIKIDGVLHVDEIAYCKALAIKLKFKPEIIDHFAHTTLPDLPKFIQQAVGFRL